MSNLWSYEGSLIVVITTSAPAYRLLRVMQSQLSGRRDNFSISATSAVSPRWRRRDQSELAARALGQWARGNVAAPGTAKYRQLSRSSWANGAIRIYSGNWREIYCVFWSGTFCHVKLKEGEREIKLRIGSIILGTTINIYSIEVALFISLQFFSTSIRFSESPTSMNVSQIIVNSNKQ